MKKTINTWRLLRHTLRTFRNVQQSAQFHIPQSRAWSCDFSASPFGCISFTEHCKWAPDRANAHFKSFSCKGMKQSQTSWMNRERIWHEIDIHSQGEANVLGYGLQAHPFSCKIGLFLRLFYSGGFFGLFNSLWSSSLSTWILRGGHICLLSLAQHSIRSQVFVWMKM